MKNAGATCPYHRLGETLRDACSDNKSSSPGGASVKKAREVGNFGGIGLNAGQVEAGLKNLQSASLEGYEDNDIQRAEILFQDAKDITVSHTGIKIFLYLEAYFNEVGYRNYERKTFLIQAVATIDHIFQKAPFYAHTPDEISEIKKSLQKIFSRWTLYHPKVEKDIRAYFPEKIDSIIGPKQVMRHQYDTIWRLCPIFPYHEALIDACLPHYINPT